MSQQEGADARSEPRTNLFLGAVIRGAGLSVPVKVRNMSVAGALVEGAVLPEQDAEVQLVRGSLVVSAIVAWCSRGRCGLRFSSLACVRDWLAPQTNSAQQRVDDTVRVLKLGAVPMPQRSGPQADASCDGAQSLQFGEDLQRAMRLVEGLSQELSNDKDLVVRHGEKLQNIDIALQTIAVVVDALAGRMAESVVAARLGNLRVSCAAALDKIRPAP